MCTIRADRLAGMTALVGRPWRGGPFGIRPTDRDRLGYDREARRLRRLQVRGDGAKLRYSALLSMAPDKAKPAGAEQLAVEPQRVFAPLERELIGVQATMWAVSVVAIFAPATFT